MRVRPEASSPPNGLTGSLPDRCWPRTSGIGILLCKSSDRLMVEYALRDVSKPIGVAGYQIVEALPEQLEGNLPTVEQLEEELGESESNTQE